MMRRFLLFPMLCALLVATAAPAPSGPLRDDYWAISFFEVPAREKTLFDLYAVFVLQGGDIGSDPHMHGGLLRATGCQRIEESDGTQTLRCKGSSVTRIRNSDDFEMTLDATRASLRATRRNHVHRLEWVATDEVPSSAGWAEVCSSGQGEGAGIARYAEARGRVFGRTLVGDPDDPRQLHVLIHGATVTQCLPWLSAAEISDLFDGGTVSVTY